LTGNRNVAAFPDGADFNEPFEHHFCESCASRSPLSNPVLRYGADVIQERLRVVSASSERTRVRLIRTESDATPEEWDLLTSRLPAKYAVVGLEFEVICSPEELEQLKQPSE
jgi:hypothetical protein